MKSQGFGPRAATRALDGLTYASVLAFPVSPLFFGIAFHGAANPLQAAANTVLVEAAAIVAVGVGYALGSRVVERAHSRCVDLSFRNSPTLPHTLLETKRLFAAAKAAQSAKDS
jgi:hypothetical protein